MTDLLKNICIYLLAFVIAVVSPGCTRTQPVVFEPSNSTILQYSSESGDESFTAQEDHAETVPDERKTEGDGTSAVGDAVGTVVKVVLVAALAFIYFAALGSAYGY